MVKNTKRKGSNLELAFKRYFTHWGYLVTKAGGSFGVDLVAIKKDHKPVLVNVKWHRNYCGPAERQELLIDAERTGGMPILAYKHIPKGKTKGIHCIELLRDSRTQGVRIFLGSLESSSLPLLLTPEQ